MWHTVSTAYFSPLIAFWLLYHLWLCRHSNKETTRLQRFCKTKETLSIRWKLLFRACVFFLLCGFEKWWFGKMLGDWRRSSCCLYIINLNATNARSLILATTATTITMTRRTKYWKNELCATPANFFVCFRYIFLQNECLIVCFALPAFNYFVVRAYFQLILMSYMTVQTSYMQSQMYARVILVVFI